MKKSIEIQGKKLEISTTREADAVLNSRKLPLVVEMELLFDTLLSKKVRFLALHANDQSSGSEKPVVNVNEKLVTRFRPVVMACEKDRSNTEIHQCELRDFPIARISAYVPKWLRIDFRFGHWYGEFGY